MKGRSGGLPNRGKRVYSRSFWYIELFRAKMKPGRVRQLRTNRAECFPQHCFLKTTHSMTDKKTGFSSPSYNQHQRAHGESTLAGRRRGHGPEPSKSRSLSQGLCRTARLTTRDLCSRLSWRTATMAPTLPEA